VSRRAAASRPACAMVASDPFPYNGDAPGALDLSLASQLPVTAHGCR
jgi:hypothetical protein